MSLTADMGMIAITIGGNQVAHQALVRVNDEIDRLRAFAEAEAKRYLDACNDKAHLRAERDALLAEKNHLKDWKERAFKAEDEIDLLQAQNRAHLDTILYLQMEIVRSKVIKTAKEVE